MTVANARMPFLDVQSFAIDEAESPPPEPRGAVAMRSPFLSVYELDGHEAEGGLDDPQREAFASFVDELHDDEFDEALFELSAHTRALHDEQLDMGASRADADRFVTQRFAQLIRESEAMVDAMAREFGSRGDTELDEHEVDSFVANYAPPQGFSPEFENFSFSLFKKLGNFAKRAASSAWRGIKSVALVPIFNAIKGVLQPVLNGVLQQAIGRLPEPVQPAALMLARKLGLAPPEPAPAPSANDPAVQVAAGQGATDTQQELDERFASALFARDEAELSMETTQLRTDAGGSASPVFAELEDARERFIQRLTDMQPGESAAPHIQEFLPAVTAALRLGFRVLPGGRSYVLNFLSGLLAKLIAKLIGPEQAPALSRAIVDAGFHLMGLEVAESEMPRLAASAVASTVEEAIGRVAALPDHVLDNPELLESFALEAFEQAAAANLPALFSEATYRDRPELLEAGVNAGWVLLPLRGRKRYKRCTRVFKVSVSPHMAGEIESFEGAALADYLQDQYGLDEGAEVDAHVNLYEALPGTSLADIAHGERETLGPGLSDEANAAQLHPLTPQAAAVLLNKPGLGRDLPAAFDKQRLAAGQRLFHVGVAGQRPLTVRGHGHRSRLRRSLHVGVTLDRPNDWVRVCVFVSEVKAQKLAQRLRDPAHAAALAARFQRWIGRRLEWILSGRAPRRLRVVHANLRPGPAALQALADLPQSARHALATHLQAWLVRGFAEFAKTQSQRFLAATENAADGVTLRFTVEHPPGLKEFMQALTERGAAASSIVAALNQGPAPTVRVEALPGHRCGKH